MSDLIHLFDSTVISGHVLPVGWSLVWKGGWSISRLELEACLDAWPTSLSVSIRSADSPASRPLHSIVNGSHGWIKTKYRQLKNRRTSLCLISTSLSARLVIHKKSILNIPIIELQEPMCWLQVSFPDLWCLPFPHLKTTETNGFYVLRVRIYPPTRLFSHTYGELYIFGT